MLEPDFTTRQRRLKKAFRHGKLSNAAPCGATRACDFCSYSGRVGFPAYLLRVVCLYHQRVSPIIFARFENIVRRIKVVRNRLDCPGCPHFKMFRRGDLQHVTIPFGLGGNPCKPRWILLQSRMLIRRILNGKLAAFRLEQSAQAFRPLCSVIGKICKPSGVKLRRCSCFPLSLSVSLSSHSSCMGVSPAE